MQPDGPRLRYLRPLHGKGPAVARNMGWRAAEAPLVAFTDDDTVPAHDWLAAGRMALMDHPEWSAAGGRVTVPRSHEAPTDHALMTHRPGSGGVRHRQRLRAPRRACCASTASTNASAPPGARTPTCSSASRTRSVRSAAPTTRWCAHPVRGEPWGASLRRQRNVVFDALLYKKHPQRYRRSIRRAPPWDYYAIVALSAGAAVAVAAGAPRLSLAALAAAGMLIGRFAWRRLARTSHARRHVIEMLCTSALIPFASVYWRLRGALRWRTAFL